MGKTVFAAAIDQIAGMIVATRKTCAPFVAYLGGCGDVPNRKTRAAMLVVRRGEGLICEDAEELHKD